MSLEPKTYALCEALADLVWLYTHDIDHEKVARPDDSRETVHRCIEWAVEFEKANDGETWTEREYLEDVEKFYLRKTKEL